VKYMCLGHLDETMVQGKEIGLIAVKGIALLVMLGMAWQAMAQNAKTTYPNMAPVDQYSWRIGIPKWGSRLAPLLTRIEPCCWPDRITQGPTVSS
jgi:hypothetical protein